jgi:HD-like signal output (HDOD) protein
MDDAAGVVEEDPALAARVLVAAGAAPGSNEKVRSVQQAMTVLGPGNLRHVLSQATAFRTYESSDYRLRDAYGALSRHARAVASGARLAAMMFRAGDPGEAHLAGLLHDLGKLAAGSLLAEAEHRLLGTKTSQWLDPDAWIDVVERTHSIVGCTLAQTWGLPDAVVRSVANSSLYDEGSPRSVVNCVCVVNALAKEVGLSVGRVDAADVASEVRAGQKLLDAADRGLDTLRANLASFRPSRAAFAAS